MNVILYAHRAYLLWCFFCLCVPFFSLSYSRFLSSYIISLSSLLSLCLCLCLCRIYLLVKTGRLLSRVFSHKIQIFCEMHPGNVHKYKTQSMFICIFRDFKSPLKATIWKIKNCNIKNNVLLEKNQQNCYKFGTRIRYTLLLLYVTNYYNYRKANVDCLLF